MMWGLELDRNHPFPMSRQLTAQLRTRILDGTLAPGTRLPPTRDLARDLGVSRNLVAGAYDQLVAEGYLRGLVGSGTYVLAIGPGPTEVRGPVPGFAPSIASSTIDFASATGTPDLRLFPTNSWKACVRRSWDEASYRDLGFGTTEGDQKLREEVANMVLRHKEIRCSPGQIFLTSGATQGLGQVLQFLRADFTSLVLETPSVGSFRRVARTLGYRTDLCPVDDDGLVTDALGPATGRGLSLVTPSHQFPTGGLLPIRRRLELLAWTGNGYVLEDDYDGETRFQGAPVPPLFSLAPDKVFYAGTFNKTLFPSVQLGFLLVPNRLVPRFRLFRTAVSIWPNTLHQRTLGYFLASGAYDRHLRVLKKEYALRRKILEDELKAVFPGEVEIKGSPTGAFLRAKFPALCPVDWTKTIDYGFRTVSTGAYQSPRAPGYPEVLLGYGNLEPEELRAGVAQLKDFISTHPASRGHPTVTSDPTRGWGADGSTKASTGRL